MGSKENYFSKSKETAVAVIDSVVIEESTALENICEVLRKTLCYLCLVHFID
jgi:hypothetical protein